MSEEHESYAPSQKAQRARTTGYAATSKRRMSRGRKIWYALLAALAKGIARTIWATCRIEKVIGQEHMDAAHAAGKPIIPCYWHQMHIYGARYMLDQIPWA